MPLARRRLLVAADVPDLRRAYVKFPWAHLYEYPASAAYVTVERDYRGEKAVFGYRIKDPAALSIRQIADHLKYAATAPVEEVKTFRRALTVDMGGFSASLQRWDRPP